MKPTKRFWGPVLETLRRYLGSDLRPTARALCVAALVAIACRVLYEAYARSLPFKFDVWSVGDWLIGYYGGNLRRGLAGTLFIELSQVSGIRPEFPVFVVKALCYSLLYGSAIRFFLADRPLKPVHALLLLSPVALLFPMNDLAGGGRKEIVLLAVAWAVPWAGQREKGGHAVLRAMTSLLLVMLHEGLLFFLPLLALCWATLRGEARLRPRADLLPLLPAALYTLLVLLRGPASPATRLAVVEAIDPERAHCWADGPVQWLGGSTAGALQATRAVFRANPVTLHTLLLALALIVLTVLPFALCAWVDYHRGRRRALWHATWPSLGACLLFQLPLFALTLDWGRWVHVNAVVAAAIYMSLHARQPPAERDAGPSRRSMALVQAAVVVAWMTLWGIQHCCTLDVWIDPEQRVEAFELNEYPGNSDSNCLPGQSGFR